MIKLSKNKIFIAGFASIVLFGALVVAYYANDRTIPFTEKYPNKFARGYQTDSEFFSCSQEIELRYTGLAERYFVGEGPEYVPVNQNEADKYCRSSGIIEYRAVIDILKREDVSKIIDKYDTTQAWVRALGHKYIHDKGYLDRILPAYSHMKIDCIIVVHSPEGTRFFIENGEVHKSHNDHQYIEISSDAFLASLNKASNSDVNNFWLGLH